MSAVKAFGVAAIMLTCFVVIYPRFMHPLVLRALGLYEPTPKQTDDIIYPPHYKAMQEGGAKPTPAHDDPRKQMRSPPHPGMRAAAEMQRHQAQQGSGRGMMGLVLPMYAIGIVLYLIYTLFKVFNKNKGNSWNGDGSQYEEVPERTFNMETLRLPPECQAAGDVRTFFTDDEQRKELEYLLTRCDDKNVSMNEMRMLQRRLEETEAQMSKILKAMQSVQSTVDTVSQPQDQEKPQGDSADPDKSKDISSEKGVADREEQEVMHKDTEVVHKDTEVVHKDTEVVHKDKQEIVPQKTTSSDISGNSSSEILSEGTEAGRETEDLEEIIGGKVDAEDVPTNASSVRQRKKGQGVE